MTEREIFLAALEIEDPARRIVYVNQACGTDLNLRTAVVTLLNAHAQTSQFLETPAASEAATIDQTVVTHNVQHDDHTDAEREAGEAAFRRYLEPATRPGWIGRLAHYEIEAILGSGAFGIVAKAFDEKLHRVVAIKLMNPGLATTSPPRKRFLREARTAAAVTHENLVAIHAVEEEPIPYLVMEYVPGQTLQQRMNAQGPLELKELLRIGQQVAAGLAAAHATNLIHRDIKPANILLTGGPNERAKISDFGLARAVDDASMTSSGMIAGTPLYMAPEQARGEPLDHRADLFSLGSVLYQMASGRPPFRAANTIAVLKRVCEDTPRPLADVIPEIPGWLDTIIFKLLEKNRDDRYQTAQEVADLLARCQRELEHTGHVTAVPQKEPLPVVGSSNAQATKEPKSPQTKPEVTKNRSVAFGMVLAFCAVLFVTVLAPRIGRWFQATIPPLPQTQNIGGLRFDGKDDYVEVTGLDWNYPQFTIEAFVTSDPASDNGTIAFLGSGANDDEEWLSLYDGGPADAGKRISGAAVHGKDGFQNAYGPFSGGVRQHRALVCSERMIDYYINGVWQGQRRAEPHEGGQWKMKELRLGCDGNGRKFFQGVIDELRISRVARYTQSFDLIASVIEDDLTLALYRPREGQGVVMKDLSGNGHDGNIVGASWVKTKAPSPSTSSETDPTLVQRQQSAERQLMDWLFANQGAVIVATPGQAIARQPDPNNPRFMEPGVRHHKKEDLPSDSASLLGVFSGKLTDSQVQFIGDCRQLEHIMAWASPLTNEALAPIVALPKLRSLSLAHTKITAEGIPTLIRAAGLVQLDLGALPLTDDSLIELARLEKLEYLSLWGSQVTDDGLNRLSGLKSLRTLVLNRTRVTEKGAESLQRALPECLILTDDNSTGTPWYGWPFDAPKPAIAPFDAAQARKHQEQWAVYLKVPVEYTNSLGMKFHLIPPGEFMMGSTAGEIAAALGDAVDNQQWQGYINSEAPQHKVILTQPIYLGVNEVTQAEFEKVIGVNPSYFAPIGMGKEAVAGLETTDHPVDSVSWNDAAEFCAKLSQQEKLKPFYFRARETITPLDGTGYRLPSEAEWEFACRAGTATKYWIGDKDEDLGRAGWFGGNSGGRTHAAGELKANPFGLSDIHGNVYEWVQDGWDASYYGQFLEKPAINPNIPILAGSLCVIRGGFWFNSAPRSRSSVRVGRDPTLRHETIGFRVLLPVDAVRQAISTSTVKNSSPTPAETAGTAEGNYSIRLAPGAHVEVPSLTFDLAAPYTLEAWVTPLDASHADKHVAGWTGPCSLFVSRAERNWSFGLSRTGGPYQFLASPTAVVIDRRVHLAAVRTGREFRLYLDGQRVGNSQEHPSPLIQPRAPFSLSSPRQPFAGDYDEVRVSRVARYDENFTPKLRLEPDADTLALYHCDENGGEQLVDASSHKHHGKIVGPAKWIGSGKAAAIADAPKPAIAPFDAAAARAHQEVWAKHLGVPVEYTNSIGMKFRLIPPGEFLMGSTPEEVESTMKAVAPDDMLYREAVKTETPRHKVVLTKALYLGVHEVTQKQYQEIMGTNPSAFGGADIDNRRVKDAATIAVLSEGTDTANFPVDSLSWNDAAEFCAKLSQKEQFKPSYFRAGNSVTMLEGNGYRLPTEAEWEFACRAGTTTRYWSGDKDADLRSIAWFGPNAGKQSHTVGELKPNPFGLYDMHGNLWEWVQDWWEPGYYDQFTESPATDPLGASMSSVKKRVVRGGYWRGNSASCRASYRNAYAASTRDHVLGFRVTLDVESVRGSLLLGEKSPVPPRAVAPFDAAAAKTHQEAWAKHLGTTVETTNSIGMEFPKSWSDSVGFGSPTAVRAAGL